MMLMTSSTEGAAITTMLISAGVSVDSGGRVKRGLDWAAKAGGLLALNACVYPWLATQFSNGEDEGQKGR